MSAVQKCSSSESTISRLSKLSQKSKSFISLQTKGSDKCSDNISFFSAYTSICAKYKLTRPMQCVKVNVKDNSIEVLGDRMKGDDWRVVMEALSTDISTHCVCIRNRRYLKIFYRDYDTLSSVLKAPK